MRTIEEYKALAEYISFNTETGDTTWVRCINSRIKVGSISSHLMADGYRYIRFKSKRFLEHRVVWFLTFGDLPCQLDHINMKRDDNRICNLRVATISENGMNKGKQKNNTSGFKGVTFHTGNRMFNAKITKNRVRTFLGYFKTAEEAYQAYTKASGEVHGEFARN